MFRKLETEEYPEEKRPTQPRFHGRHQLNRHPDGLEKCVGCELCAWACPADAILVEGAATTTPRAARPVLARRALRPRLPDQLPALHLLRPVHRGLPDPRADDDQLLRAGRQQPRRPHLHQGAAARAAQEGMLPPPHPMVEGLEERDYYQGKVARPTPDQEALGRDAAARSGATCRSVDVAPAATEVAADDRPRRADPASGSSDRSRARRARAALRQEGRPRRARHGRW